MGLIFSPWSSGYILTPTCVVLFILYYSLLSFNSAQGLKKKGGGDAPYPSLCLSEPSGTHNSCSLISALRCHPNPIFLSALQPSQPILSSLPFPHFNYNMCWTAAPGFEARRRHFRMFTDWNDDTWDGQVCLSGSASCGFVLMTSFLFLSHTEDDLKKNVTENVKNWTQDLATGVSIHLLPWVMHPKAAPPNYSAQVGAFQSSWDSACPPWSPRSNF